MRLNREIMDYGQWENYFLNKATKVVKRNLEMRLRKFSEVFYAVGLPLVP